MTIINATGHLVKYFEQFDSFNLKDDFKKLFPNHISETLEADQAALLAALEELIATGICRRAAINKQDFYLLIRPINQLNQSVNLSYITIQLISQILSKASEKLKDQEISFDPLRLEEKDILLSLTILNECVNIKNQE